MNQENTLMKDAGKQKRERNLHPITAYSFRKEHFFRRNVLFHTEPMIKKLFLNADLCRNQHILTTLKAVTLFCKFPKFQVKKYF